MTLAIFDLDNTLIAGDSDYLWGEFLCQSGRVEHAEFALKNAQFFSDYEAGVLDMGAYLRFALEPLKHHSMDTLNTWHREFMDSKIAPIMLPKAAQLIERHRQQGHELLIITATSRFVTGPIAEALSISALIACDAEQINGRFTGKPIGVASYGQGKVTRLEAWMAERGQKLEGAYFYSDSRNDLPLLELVDNPVAVDPDPVLYDVACESGWPIISLREGSAAL